MKRRAEFHSDLKKGDYVLVQKIKVGKGSDSYYGDSKVTKELKNILGKVGIVIETCVQGESCENSKVSCGCTGMVGLKVDGRKIKPNCYVYGNAPSDFTLLKKISKEEALKIVSEYPLNRFDLIANYKIKS